MKIKAIYTDYEKFQCDILPPKPLWVIACGNGFYFSSDYRLTKGQKIKRSVLALIEKTEEQGLIKIVERIK